MNIFVLNNCPIESAKIQHDKHIVKMVLESAQMLCSAFDQDKFKAVIEWCLDNVSKIDIQNSYITPFAQAMPDKYKSENAVKSYINYYIGEKLNNAKWTNRNIPNVFQDYFDSVKN